VALLASELARCKFELGYNVLTIGAEPMIGVSYVFEGVIQNNVSAGAVTSSSTAVTAATSATPVTITLASGTGFATGARVVIDVDDRQEVVTAELVTGTALTVLLQKAHAGTYPVTVDGGETIVREILQQIRGYKDELGRTFGTGAVAQVDEIKFFPTGGKTLFENLCAQIDWARDELASALGIVNLRRVRRNAGSTISMY
jgi:hypothetical protein